MAAKKKSGGNTVAVVRALAEPIAKDLGLSVWDVRFLKEGGLWYLRVFIDKPEGIGIEDCEAMSRAINGPLDEADPIEQSYCLEVCSPGINRELTRPEHFAAFLGSPVLVRRFRPDENGERDVCGILAAYTGDAVKLETEETDLTIDKKDVSSVRLIEDEFVEVDES